MDIEISSIIIGDLVEKTEIGSLRSSVNEEIQLKDQKMLVMRRYICKVWP